MSASIADFLSIESGNRNIIRLAWDNLHGLPGGKALFSRMIGRTAAYTGTIGATVKVLRPGHGEVEMPDRPAVRNHLHSVHAVALVNLAELAGNVVVAYGLPDDARFIVAGLSIEYLKKARGAITGVCDIEVPATSEKRELAVPVSLRNARGEEVARATLRTLIGPKK
jgi:acyl-coenzyme A thioesterase PaaI-like protein